MATKTKAKKKPRPKRAKQQHLPGMEPPSIKEIDSAADRYCELRDERMREGKAEKEARLILEAMMKKHEITEYEYDSKIVKMLQTCKASARTAKDADDEDESDSE